MIKHNPDRKINIILVDIDNCILPTIDGVCTEDEALWLFEFNTQLLNNIVNRFYAYVIMVSSKVINNTLLDNIAFKQHPVCGKLNGRIEDVEDMSKKIKELIQNKDIGRVIIISNNDYSSNVNPNNRSYFIEVKGFINRDDMFKIEKSNSCFISNVHWSHWC